MTQIKFKFVSAVIFDEAIKNFEAILISYFLYLLFVADLILFMLCSLNKC